MRKTDLFDHITIDERAPTPKYLQLAECIQKAAEAGVIGKGFVLPSINEVACRLNLSRDPVQRSYRRLKNEGFISAIPGKVFFVCGAGSWQRLKIFLLFNKLSIHKKIMYDAFVQGLGGNVLIDFYIYDNDFALFKKLIEERRADYTHYVIVPHFVTGGEKAYES